MSSARCNIILVIAGNKQQAEPYLTKKDMYKRIYIASATDLYGHRDCYFQAIGEYWKNPLWEEFLFYCVDNDLKNIGQAVNIPKNWGKHAKPIIEK